MNMLSVLVYIQHGISFCGALIIMAGILIAVWQFVHYLFVKNNPKFKIDINKIRLNLGLTLTLGLEFIVAADLIGTTTAPDYYSIGIVAAIVLIRTLLSYTLNREINSIRKMEEQEIHPNPH